jgi:hypothetical protein
MEASRTTSNVQFCGIPQNHGSRDAVASRSTCLAWRKNESVPMIDGGKDETRRAGGRTLSASKIRMDPNKMLNPPIPRAPIRG